MRMQLRTLFLDIYTTWRNVPTTANAHPDH